MEQPSAHAVSGITDQKLSLAAHPIHPLHLHLHLRLYLPIRQLLLEINRNEAPKAGFTPGPGPSPRIRSFLCSEVLFKNAQSGNLSRIYSIGMHLIPLLKNTLHNRATEWSTSNRISAWRENALGERTWWHKTTARTRRSIAIKNNPIGIFIETF